MKISFRMSLVKVIISLSFLSGTAYSYPKAWIDLRASTRVLICCEDYVLNEVYHMVPYFWAQLVYRDPGPRTKEEHESFCRKRVRDRGAASSKCHGGTSVEPHGQSLSLEFGLEPRFLPKKGDKFEL